MKGADSREKQWHPNNGVLDRTVIPPSEAKGRLPHCEETGLTRPRYAVSACGHGQK